MSAAAPIRIERVRDNLFVLRGGGRFVEIGGVAVPQAGNTAAFVAPRGVVLVDTKLPGSGAEIRGALREITEKPIVAIVNTHAHVDHVGGNPDLAAGVEIVAHERAAEAMRDMRPVTGGSAQPSVFAASGGRGLPTRTFADRTTLFEGEDAVEIHWFGASHSGGDAWVVFPALRAAHAGDAFAHQAVPLIDVASGGSGAAYPDTLARAAAALASRDVETIVAGHHPDLLALSDLEDYARFVRELADDVRDAKRRGLSASEFGAGWRMPERWTERGYVSIAHLRPPAADFETIWRETP